MEWDEYYLNLAREVAKRSKDPSTQVGAVIVDENNVVRATGYNGFPRGVSEPYERWQRPTKYSYVIHAELNAILNSQLLPNNQYTIYTTHDVCHECAKAIIQAGIKRVVSAGGSFATDWDEKRELARTMLKEADVEFEFYENE